MRYLNHIFKIFDISKYRVYSAESSDMVSPGRSGPWSLSGPFPVDFRDQNHATKDILLDQWHPKLDILKHFRQLDSELFVVMRLSDISILTATSTTFFNYVHFRTTVTHFTTTRFLIHLRCRRDSMFWSFQVCITEWLMLKNPLLIHLSSIKVSHLR